MTHLLDTNAVLDLLTPPPGAAMLLPAEAETHVSVITQIELSYGLAAVATDPVKLMMRTSLLVGVLSRWRPLPLDRAAADAFVRTATHAVSLGVPPRKNMNDLMIVSVALSRGWTLVTADQGMTRIATDLVPVVELR